MQKAESLQKPSSIKGVEPVLLRLLQGFTVDSRVTLWGSAMMFILKPVVNISFVVEKKETLQCIYSI